MIGISCPLRIPARRLAVLVACLVSGQPVAGEAQIHDAPQALLRLEEFSPGLLGIYRKMMRIESDIVKYSREYDVDAGLAKAVCLYESGGNASLTSIAGAQGYFQVMPSTFRLMRVETNIEAGIKYLSSLVRQFGREDYALAGYNGGPTRVARGRAMPLESLQYVIGVGHYRSVLKAYEPSVRAHASQLNITTVRRGEDWWALSDRLNLPVVQLRLHNPFLAARPLKPGATVAFPAQARTDLFKEGDGSRYLVRLGDNYIKLAFALNVDVSQLRDTNGLWHLQSTLPGTELTIPVHADATYGDYTVRANDTLRAVATKLEVDPWWIVRDNHVWDERLTAEMVLRIRRPTASRGLPAPPKTQQVHRIRRGDTLTSIARRYGTSVKAIQATNGLGRSAVLKADQRLRIPSN